MIPNRYVKPEEGIHVLYARATISQMRDLHASHSSPVQEAMFHNRGFSTSQNPRKQVKPGVTLDETRAALDRKYIIGMGICENISSAPEAKKILQNGLAHEHYEGYANVQQASQRYKCLQDKQKQERLRIYLALIRNKVLLLVQNLVLLNIINI